MVVPMHVNMSTIFAPIMVIRSDDVILIIAIIQKQNTKKDKFTDIMIGMYA